MWQNCDSQICRYVTVWHKILAIQNSDAAKKSDFPYARPAFWSLPANGTERMLDVELSSIVTIDKL